MDTIPSLFPLSKTCSKCGEEKPLEEFYIKDRSTGRRMARCRACLSVQSHARYHLNPGPNNARSVAWQKANKPRCAAARKRRHEADPEKYRAKWREIDAKRRGKKTVYRKANAVRIKAWAAEYRRRNAAKIAAYNADYYRDNKEVVTQRIQKCNAAKPDHYNQLHKAAKHRRKVRLVNQGPHERFTDLEIFKRDGWVCQLCKDPVDRSLIYPNPRSASLDHVLPIAKGGGHTRANAQLAHLGCNSRKRDRLAASAG